MGAHQVGEGVDEHPRPHFPAGNRRSRRRLAGPAGPKPSLLRAEARPAVSPTAVDAHPTLRSALWQPPNGTVLVPGTADRSIPSSPGRRMPRSSPIAIPMGFRTLTRVDDARLGDVLLVATEPVTDAYDHGGGPSDIRISHTPVPGPGPDRGRRQLPGPPGARDPIVRAPPVAAARTCTTSPTAGTCATIKPAARPCGRKCPATGPTPNRVPRVPLLTRSRHRPHPQRGPARRPTFPAPQEKDLTVRSARSR